MYSTIYFWRKLVFSLDSFLIFPLMKYSRVVLRTNYGDITLELTDDLTPRTVENFLGLVRKGYYDGVIFHRVIKDFMIQ